MEVDRHHLFPGVEVDVDRAAATTGERGTVHHGVESTERVNRFLHTPRVVVEHGQVADRDDGLAAGGFDETERGLGPLARDVGDGDLGALRREQHCDRFADAEQVAAGCGTGAGDERPLPDESVALVVGSRPRLLPDGVGRVAHRASLAPTYLPMSERAAAVVSCLASALTRKPACRADFVACVQADTNLA